MIRDAVHQCLVQPVEVDFVELRLIDVVHGSTLHLSVRGFHSAHVPFVLKNTNDVPKGSTRVAAECKCPVRRDGVLPDLLRESTIEGRTELGNFFGARIDLHRGLHGSTLPFRRRTLHSLEGGEQVSDADLVGLEGLGIGRVLNRVSTQGLDDLLAELHGKVARVDLLDLGCFGFDFHGLILPHAPSDCTGAQPVAVFFVL